MFVCLFASFVELSFSRCFMESLNLFLIHQWCRLSPKSVLTKIDLPEPFLHRASHHVDPVDDIGHEIVEGTTEDGGRSHLVRQRYVLVGRGPCVLLNSFEYLKLS